MSCVLVVLIHPQAKEAQERKERGELAAADDVLSCVAR